MKKTIYGCTLLIIGTMFLLGNLTLYIPAYIIGIIFLIFDAMFGNNKDLKKAVDNNDEASLIHLRDIRVLSNEELEDAIKLFNGQSLKDKEDGEYLRCLKVLNQLKERGYLTDNILKEKIINLKSHYNID